MTDTNDTAASKPGSETQPTTATPSGVEVVARMPDGSEINVTEGVMCLYDLVINSMDWGSGFLSTEEAIPVVKVARTCGFAEWERAYEYVNRQEHSAEQKVFLSERGMNPYTRTKGDHEHLYSSVGICMWPLCDAVSPDA